MRCRQCTVRTHFHVRWNVCARTRPLRAVLPLPVVIIETCFHLRQRVPFVRCIPELRVLCSSFTRTTCSLAFVYEAYAFLCLCLPNLLGVMLVYVKTAVLAQIPSGCEEQLQSENGTLPVRCILCGDNNYLKFAVCAIFNIFLLCVWMRVPSYALALYL